VSCLLCSSILCVCLLRVGVLTTIHSYEKYSGAVGSRRRILYANLPSIPAHTTAHKSTTMHPQGTRQDPTHTRTHTPPFRRHSFRPWTHRYRAEAISPCPNLPGCCRVDGVHFQHFPDPFRAALAEQKSGPRHQIIGEVEETKLDDGAFARFQVFSPAYFDHFSRLTEDPAVHDGLVATADGGGMVQDDDVGFELAARLRGEGDAAGRESGRWGEVR